MCEDVCRTVHIARQLGEPTADLRRTTSAVSTTATRTTTDNHDHEHPFDPFADKEIWFLTGSQSLYGDDTLAPGRRAVGRGGRRARAASAVIPVRIVPQAGAHHRRRDPSRLPRRPIRRPLHRRRSPGCTPSPRRRCGSAGSQALGKPLLHLHTQANRSLPWSTIDMDFMNLNQAAHGDREFGFVQTRMGIERKTVFGHVDDPEVQQSVGRWARAAAGWHDDAAPCASPGSATTCATSPSPKATRSRPRSASACRSTPGASTTSSPPSADADRRRCRHAGRRVRRHLHDGRRPASRRRPPRLGPRGGARSRSGCAASSTDGGFGAFTTNFEDLGGLRQLPGLAVQRLMADGYGFGGEGDWKTVAAGARREGDGRTASRRHLASWRTTRTTSVPAPRRPSAPTCSRSARPSPPAGPRSRSTRSPSAAARTRPGSCSTPPPGPAIVVGLADLGDRFRLVANEIDTVDARRTAAPRCPSPAPCGPRDPICAPRPPRGSSPAARTTPCTAAPSTARSSTTSPPSPGVELAFIDADDHRPIVPRRAALERRLVPPQPGHLTW